MQRWTKGRLRQRSSGEVALEDLARTIVKSSSAASDFCVDGPHTKVALSEQGVSLYNIHETSEFSSTNALLINSAPKDLFRRRSEKCLFYDDPFRGVRTRLIDHPEQWRKCVVGWTVKWEKSASFDLRQCET